MNAGGTNTPARLPLAIYMRPMLMLVVALLWLCGCRTHGYRKSDLTGKSLYHAALDIRAESQAIDATVEAINDLVNHPASDLKPQFKRFSTALDRLSASSERAEATRQRMEEKGSRYFTAWDEQISAISYGIVREQSESRFSQVTNRFYSLNSRYVDAQGVVRPLIKYFNDIRTALSVDLTTAGLDSVKSIAANAAQNSRKVQTELGRLADELASSGASMSSLVQATPNANPQARTPVRAETPPENSVRVSE